LKSGSLTLLEPSGPVQACNGIALSLPLLMIGEKKKKKFPMMISVKLIPIRQ